MSEQVIEMVTQYIDALAAKLGVAAEHVYEVMIKQMVFEGAVGLTASLLCLILSVLVLWKSIPAFLKAEKEHDLHLYGENYDRIKRSDAERRAMVALIISIIFGVVGIASIGVVIIGGPQFLMQILNPEYYVIREILSALGNIGG